MARKIWVTLGAFGLGVLFNSPNSAPAAATACSCQRPVSESDQVPGQKPSVTPGGSIKEYETLLRDYEETIARNNAEFERIKLDDAKRKEFHRTKGDWNVHQEFAGRFLKLARSQPESPSAFYSLAWIAAFAHVTSGAEAAASLLARDHAGDPRLWSICQHIARGPTYPACGVLLRAVMEHHGDREIRARACLALADYLVQQADFVRLQNVPGLEPWQAQFFPKDRSESFRTINAESACREAEALYARVVKDFALIRPSTLKYSELTDDVRSITEKSSEVIDDRDTLGELARSRLTALQTLSVGKLAPGLAGNDVQGVAMSLGDFKGRVVLLTFSGDWCGPCNAMMPHEREIVEHFKDRPFAMVSVNSTERKEKLLELIASKAITWRCWWDPRGDSNGPIATRWHVLGWPTVYLIDHQGTIRVKFVGFVGRSLNRQPPIDAAVEALVAQAEAARRP